MANRQPRQNDAAGILPAPAIPQADAPPLQQGAGNRRRRPANRRGKGGRGPQAQDATGASAPTLPPPTGAPSPKYLAARATPERNDPLWCSGAGGVDVNPTTDRLFIRPGCEALPALTSVMHSSLVAASTGYSRKISEGMLGYYAAVLTWQRMLTLAEQNGFRLSADEDRFIRQVGARSYSPPLLLASYLAGFGNTRMPNGRDVRFQLYDRPATVRANTLRGFWGVVNANTQPLYQNYPCLAVYAGRLLAGLVQNDEREEPWWQLPQNVRPTIAGAIRPSMAMLGYGPRERYSSDKLDTLQGCMIFRDAFPTDNPGYSLCLNLIDVIQEHISAAGVKTAPMPTLLLGSTAQIALVRFVEELDGLASSPAQLESCYVLPREISFPAAAFAYRTKHMIDSVEGAEECAPWCVYEYNVAQVAGWAQVLAAGNRFRDVDPTPLLWAGYRSSSFLLKTKLEALDLALNSG